jgi:hypothetical protein
MVTCVACGEELHPERAEKYDYCTKPECRERHARGVEIAAVGVNKAAEQFVVLDERNKRDMASGRFKKQPDAGGSGEPTRPTKSVPRPDPAPAHRPVPPRRPWTQAQENLAVIYRGMGLKPGEIARKLGVSEHLATKILLEATARGRRS